MWIRKCVVIPALSAVACGVASGEYRDRLSDVRQRSYVPHALAGGGDVFAARDALAPDELTAAVMARNPTVELARQAWRVALARYPQAASLDDPTVGVSIAPLSPFDPDVKLGVGARVSQQLPYPGKRRLRGEVALAEADAVRADYRAVRHRLALMAVQLYYDYYLVERAIAINAEHAALLQEYSRAIDAYLVTGKAFRDDALEVDVDLAELAQQRAALESDRDVVVAQLNALLHRDSRAQLPAPGGELAPAAELAASADELATTALTQRPELAGVVSRERGAAVGVQLAQRDYYPDLRVTGTYTRMWPSISHQLMVGVSVALPVMRRRRAAAVDAASARRAQRRAERASVTADVVRDVHVAHRRATEADARLAVYRDRVLPAVRGRVDAIRLGLDAGRTSFADVIRAERELRAATLRYHAAVAAAHRTRAELAWAVGHAPAGTERGGQR